MALVIIAGAPMAGAPAALAMTEAGLFIARASMQRVRPGNHS